MIRTLNILVVLATLAVSAAPVASAVQSRKPPPRATTSELHEYGHINHYLRVTAKGGGGKVANHTESTIVIHAGGGWDPTI